MLEWPHTGNMDCFEYERFFMKILVVNIYFNFIRISIHYKRQNIYIIQKNFYI
jgi:hypothetical protein